MFQPERAIAELMNFSQMSISVSCFFIQEISRWQLSRHKLCLTFLIILCTLIVIATKEKNLYGLVPGCGQTGVQRMRRRQGERIRAHGADHLQAHG